MDLPTYDENDYPEKFLRGHSVFPPDARIFHQVGFEYIVIKGLASAQFENNILKVTANLSSGETATLSLEAVAPHVLRLRLWQGTPHFQEQSPMLLPLPQQRPTLQYREDKTAFSITADGYRLTFQKHPFCLKIFSPAGETIFESETETIVGMLTAPPLGFRRKDDQCWAFLSWRNRNQDRYYGLGEKFTKFEKTASRATIWEADTCGSNTTDMSYKAVPVLFSTAGWGIMLHSSFRSYWEVGSFSYATSSAMVEDSQLDLFLMLAPTLKRLVQLYTGLTGRPSLPPKWALGLWMSRAAYRSRPEMLEVANRLRAECIPCDVFNIDATWMKKNYYNDIGVEVCNFGWNEESWSKPENLFHEFAELGFGICLWINPYFSEDSETYAEAKAKGYLVKNSEGGISRLEFGLAAGIVDLTNPEAKAWWQEKLKALLRKGATVFKVDFGDRIPENALFYNGKTGKEMHNLYPHLYSEAVFEATREVKGLGIVWRRPGYIGSQRFPGTWAGDTQVTWEGMKGALRGGLSAAFTGEAFWSHDIGGFVGKKPSDELYIRWVQFGMFSPMTRFHGTTPREPWHYGEKALEISRRYTQLRYQLIPYLLASAQESVHSGLPILRPMVLEFQDEPGVDQIDDQYLLGNDLLVAPIFQPGVRSRDVFFPSGKWWPLDHASEPIIGPGYRRVDAPLEYLPLFVRSGAIIPRYTTAPPHLKTVPDSWTLDIYPGDSRRQWLIPETAFTIEMDYHFAADQGRLQINPAPVQLVIRWMNCLPGNLQVENAQVAWQPSGKFVSTTLDLSGGADLTFHCKPS